MKVIIENKKKIKDYYILIGLVLFSVFPIINVFRDKSENYLFNIWRDFMMYFALFGMLLVLVLYFNEVREISLKDVFNRLKKRPANVFFILMFIWMVAMTFINGATAISLIGDPRSRTGLTSYISFIGFFVVCSFFTDKKLKDLYYKLFLGIGSVVCLLILVYRYLLGNVIDLVNGLNMFYNSNHLSYYLVTLCVCALVTFILSKGKVDFVLSLVTFSLSLVCLVIGDTLGCQLAFVVAFVFMIIVLTLTKRKYLKRLGLLILVMIASVGLLILINPSCKDILLNNLSEFISISNEVESSETIEDINIWIGSGRMRIYNGCLEMMRQKPLTGFGVSQMRIFLMIWTNGTQNTAHCEFFEYGITYGIPCMVFYLCAIMSVYISGLKDRLKLTDKQIIALITAFAYLVSSCFGVTMFYTAPYLFIFLALGYCYKED